MLPNKKQLLLSPYSELYDILVPETHILKQFNELIDFEFVYDELKDKYTENFGATAKCPIFMFKLLLLKVMYPMSDRDLIENARLNMAYKYFLDVAPEETNLIHPTSLTKFRRLRLDNEKLLDKLISKTVEIALELGLIKSKQIIADATHTNSIFNHKSPVEILVEQSKQLRKTIYKSHEQYKDKMPEKPKTKKIEDHINYCNKLIELIRSDERLLIQEDIRLKTNLLEETVNDDLEEMNSTVEKDAKVGHKSADSSFFGYKSHLAMVPERIVTAAVVTTGEKHDGKEAKALIEKSIDNGIEVDTFIGDGAYSERDNILYAREKNIKLVAKLNKVITETNKKSNDFHYNKDAKRFICKAGHMAIQVALHGKKKHEIDGTPLRETHFFDINNCKICKHKEQCGYKEGQASKSYTITLRKDKVHEEHQKFQDTEEFKQLAKSRYMIEAKNGELKNSHGLDKCHSHGLLGMQIQTAMTVFVANMKRIVKLKG